MPAENTRQEQAINAEIIRGGPEMIGSIFDLIIPPGTGDDTNARYAIGSLTAYTARRGAINEQRIYASLLTEALGHAEDNEVKAFFIRQLQLAGTGESVSVLSEYLADARLCEPATAALLSINTPSAKIALYKALALAQGSARVTIIKALGTIEYKNAANDILMYVAETNTDVRMTALWAVANIGDGSADKTIRTALEKASGLEQKRIASFYLLYAQRLAENGDKIKSAKICRALIMNPDLSSQENIICNAMSTLVRVEGDDALNDLIKAMDSDNIKVRASALRLADDITGTPATKEWLMVAAMKSATVGAEVIEMLARRGDKEALPAITKYYIDIDIANKTLRLAAIKAAVKLGGDKSIGSVIARLKKTDDADETTTIQQALLYLPGNGVTSAVAGSLAQMTPNSKVAMLELLASRDATEYAEAVFAQVGNSNGSVRIAALKALSVLASADDTPRLVKLFIEAKTSKERMESQKALVAAAKQITDKQKRTESLLNAFDTVDDAKKVYILPILGQIGGREALAKVTTATKSENADIKIAAIRTLASWPDAQAIPALLEITASDVLTHQVLAVRGLAQLTKRAKLPDNKKLDIFAKALGLVDRPVEKGLLIASLSSVRTVESLELAAKYLDDESLRGIAVMAAVQIACPANKKDKGLRSYDAAVLLKKVVGYTDDAGLKEKIERQINSIGEPVSQKKTTPKGFVSLFNDRDLAGWKGLLAKPYDNPIKRAKLSPKQLAVEQAKADESMRTHWKVVNGVLQFDGDGFSLATVKEYGDFEMLVDWKIVHPNGDSGIYLRGSPQVQIWDPAFKKAGSGGLYNNKKNPSDPIVTADNPIGQWNTFRIKMIGQHVTVHLNGQLVVDNVVLENYWNRKQPIFSTEQIELQCHGDPIHFKNIFIREIPREQNASSVTEQATQKVSEGFVSLFNGRDLTGWVGDTKGYVVEDNKIICKPGGNLFTENEYSDFIFRFEFKLTTNANNGLGIRAPLEGKASYSGIELQILDNSGTKYKNLKPYQYHGSIYGVVPAKRGYLKPTGQWNYQEVIVRGKRITVILNGTTIVDADVSEAIENGTPDGKKHPGLKNESGHIGFLGHGSVVEFRNIKVKTL
jgi:HEAT repeat protein